MNFTSTTPSHKISNFQIFFLILFISVAEAQQPSDTSSSDGEDAWTGNDNVSPSMGIIIIVLVLAFFITGCISIYIQQCVTTSTSTSQGVTTVTRRGNNVIHGLDQLVIESFPTFEYSAVKELKIGKGALECAVCLNEFEESDKLRLLPKCDHVFHPECIDVWLGNHTTCPVCRANLVPNDNNDDKPVESVDHATEPVVSQPRAEPTVANDESGLNCEVCVTIHNENSNLGGEGQLRKTGLQRWNSTGHSLAQPRDGIERFTLKLPAEVRKQLIARANLKRTTSLVALPRQSSSRRGYRVGEGSGSSRYGRFGRSFIAKLGSFKSTAKVVIDGEGSVGSRRCSGPPLPV